MSTMLAGTFRHLYKLVRVYLLIGLTAIFITVLYGILSSVNPIFSSILLGVILFLFLDSSLTSWFAFLDTGFTGTNRNPPIVANFILHILLPDKNRDVVLKDLLTVYVPICNRRVEKYGIKLFADLWYWKQVLISVIPLILWRLRSSSNDSSFPITFKEDIEDILPFYRKRR